MWMIALGAAVALAADAPEPWEDGMQLRTPTDLFVQVGTVADLQGTTQVGFGDVTVGAPLTDPFNGIGWGLTAHASGAAAWTPDEERSSFGSRGVGAHLWLMVERAHSVHGLSLGYEDPLAEPIEYSLYHPVEQNARVVTRYDAYVDHGRLDWSFSTELGIGSFPSLLGSAAAVYEASDRLALTAGAQLAIDPIGRLLLGANVRPADGVEVRVGAHVPIGLYTAAIWLPEPSLQVVLHR